MSLNYLIEHFTILISVAALYYFLYRNKENFALNRGILLSALLLSVVIPFINFDVFPYEVQLTSRSFFVEGDLPMISKKEDGQSFSILWIIYFIGSFVAFVLFVKDIFKFFEVMRKAEYTKRDGCFLSVGHTSASFSFLDKIFLQCDDQVIFAHEKAHCGQLHSLDRIFLAILQVIFWFNPLIYLYRKWIIENHEFTADQLAIKELKLQRSQYAQYLLDVKESLNNNLLLINHFSSQLKSRIKMLNSKERVRPISHLFLLILLLGISSGFSLNSYPVYLSQDSDVYQDTIPNQSNILDTTIVFDPATQKEYIKVEAVKINEEGLDTAVVFDPTTGKESVVISPILGEANVGMVRIDTSIVFDPTTFKESLVVNRITLPRGVKLQENIDSKMKNEIFDKYGAKTTIEIETYAGKAGYFLNFIPEHQGFNLRIDDTSGKVVFSTKVKAGDGKFELVNAKLSPGNYTATRSDNGEMIEIRIL